MTIRVRFAPSPTGYLHIGGARTALFNYLYAKNNLGKFLLRIEDTDQERSTQEAINAILEGLNWLGISPDEKYVLQSKNQNRHIEIANELINKNQAYYCYTSSEELEDMRLSAEKKGEKFRFKSPWRHKIQSQTSLTKPVIRIKAPIEGSSIIQDLVQGKINVNNQELDDMVLLRSDNTPTYMLAVVVDDHDMEISHVIRGDDHLTNAFRQQIIYQAMNWQVPKFAHIPLIHGSDGTKMSKRHGATSVIDYKKMGYLSESLRNYLIRLGWSHGNDEIISDSDAIKYFNIEKIGKSPSRFDFAKLNFLNNFYIKNSSNEKLLELINDYLNKKIPKGSIKFLKIINFSKEKVDTIIDLANICAIYQDDFYCNINSKDEEILKNKIAILKNICEMIENISDFSAISIKENFENFNAINNLKIKDYGLALRVALTYSSASAGAIFDVVELLGKKETLKRIKLVI